MSPQMDANTPQGPRWIEQSSTGTGLIGEADRCSDFL